MSAKAPVTIEVVGVCWSARHMVGRNVQGVEAIIGRDFWLEVLEELELLTRDADI